MKKKNQKIEMNSNQDELLESFKDFKLVSKTEMSQISGGAWSYRSNVMFADDTSGIQIDAGRWTIRIHTDSNDCDQYE
ncbi:MAG: bacteriocin [Bacteroidetes bacterium]|nr:bacteriocin [Bacteroidota bacterium]